MCDAPPRSAPRCCSRVQSPWRTRQRHPPTACCRTAASSAPSPRSRARGLVARRMALDLDVPVDTALVKDGAASARIAADTPERRAVGAVAAARAEPQLPAVRADQDREHGLPDGPADRAANLSLRATPILGSRGGLRGRGTAASDRAPPGTSMAKPVPAGPTRVRPGRPASGQAGVWRFLQPEQEKSASALWFTAGRPVSATRRRRGERRVRRRSAPAAPRDARISRGECISRHG
jgi:hypothetical protein